MRPGQAAPVFFIKSLGNKVAFWSFNEAGAGCPGIPIIVVPGGGAFAIGFNEAGAGCPGIHEGWREFKRSPACFNEAGAGCPGIPRHALSHVLMSFVLQ